MSEDIVICPNCSFKCIKSQLYKTKGKCSICNTMVSKTIQTETGGI